MALPLLIGGLGLLGAATLLGSRTPKRRRRKAKRKNPVDSPLYALALKAGAGELTLGDLVPYVNQAYNIDIRGVNYFYLSNWAAHSKLPEFSLNVGDDVINYDPGQGRKGIVRILLRSGVSTEKTKNSYYAQVEEAKHYLKTTRGSKTLAAVFFARLAESAPWWTSGSAASWRFPRGKGVL